MMEFINKLSYFFGNITNYIIFISIVIFIPLVYFIKTRSLSWRKPDNLTQTENFSNNLKWLAKGRLFTSLCLFLVLVIVYIVSILTS